MEEALTIDWGLTDIAMSFDEFTKDRLSSTFWRLTVPFADEYRKQILTELPYASAIYREWASYGKRLPQKTLMTKVCSLPFMSRRLYQYFAASLDPEVRTILERVARKGPQSHKMLEEDQGITTYNLDRKDVYGNGYFREELNVLPKFKYLPHQAPSSYYYHRDLNIIFTLPEHLQRVIAVLAADPKATWPTYEELPEDAQELNLFYGEELILRELPGLIIYLNNKRPKVNKKGRPNAASIRSLGKKLALTPFYPATAQPQLMHLRANMLTSLLLQKDKLPNNAEIPNLIRKLFQDSYHQNFRSALHLLTYVNGVTSLRESSFRAVESGTSDYFKSLYQQGWVDYQAWEARKEDLGYRVDFIYPSEIGRLDLEISSEFSDSKFVTQLSIAPYYTRKFIQWPILRGQLFLLAAWGLLDLAYAEPDTRAIGITADSPYDGVRYVRLTPLGAYVLGYTDEYETTVKQPFELSLADDVLSILLSAGDMDLASRAIASFASPVGNKRFQTNADMFLQDCSTARDLQQKIDLFSTLFPGDLPANWQAFFRELSQKANPLTEEEFLVFSIDPNDQNLLRLLAQDEQIQALCSKAEGYRILVKTGDFKKLQKLLRAYGYLVE